MRDNRHCVGIMMTPRAAILLAVSGFCFGLSLATKRDRLLCAGVVVVIIAADLGGCI